MVSGLVRLVWLAALASLASLGVTALPACSNDECLRADCRTSAPVETAGSVGVAGSAGSVGVAGSAGGTPTSKACQSNEECDAAHGIFCVEQTCRVACSSHFDCQGFGECISGADSDGTAGLFCELGKKQPPGQFYARCPQGDADCDMQQGFFCVGAGGEDLDAYCSNDCTTDDSCAAGFACATLTRSPCTDACGFKGVAADRSCIPADQIGADKAWQCGTRGITRNACRPRKFCNACETDADCLATPNQLCAKDASGAKICTQRCDPARPSCPWGNAAKCGVWDTDLGVATCMHRFGQCAGTGKSCEPCVTDSDCGSQGACTSSNFTGERWCVDLSVSCSCADMDDGSGTCTGGGCPKAASGLSMICVDLTPTMPNTGLCRWANTASLLSSSQQTGCWN